MSRPNCANCGDPVDDTNVIRAAGRRVCNASCAFQLLAATEVANAVGCPVCGEEFDDGRVPVREGYDEELCPRCAREAESRAPSGGTA